MAIAMQDSFTGVDGTNLSLHVPDVGGSWIQDIAGGGNSNLSSNQLAYPGGSDMGAYRGGAAPGVDCYAQVDLTAIPDGSSSVGFGLRGSLTAGFTGYYLSIKAASITLAHHSNANDYGDYTSGFTTILTIARAPIVATYKLGVAGNDFYLYEDGILIGSVTDATYPAAGFSSVYCFKAGTGRIDNFESGDFVAPIPPADPTLLTASCSVGIGESTLADAPTTQFTADVTSGLAPLTDNFTDTSGNNPTSWLWEMDGTTYATQNVTHVFSTSGIYPVRLTATNASGSRSYQMTIMATDPPVVAPPDDGTVTPGGTPGNEIINGQIGYYVVDTGGHQIGIHGADGTLLKTFGGLGTTAGKFFNPTTCSIINGRQLIDRVRIPEE